MEHHSVYGTCHVMIFKIHHNTSQVSGCLFAVQNIVFHIQSETKFMKWHFNQRTCQMNKILYIKGEGMTSVLVLKVSGANIQKVLQIKKLK